MRRPRHWLPPNGMFHVTARGIDDERIFRDEVDYLEWVHVYRGVCRAFGWNVHAGCLMGTHYHLAYEGSLVRLSDGMQRLNGVYADRFNRRHRRRGHLFGARFSSWLILDERHLAATVRYILDNPRRAGLAGEDEPWPWAWSAADPGELLAA